MCIAALLTTVRMWKGWGCALTDRWIKEEWCTDTRTMDYDLAVKEKEILPSATTWRDLEGIVFSETSQPKTIARGFHLYLKSKNQN